VAAGDIVQNILRPSIRQPFAVRVARVAGRVRSCPGSLMAAARTERSTTICASAEPNAWARRSAPRRDGDLSAALHVEHRHEVHVHADRDGGIAARQSARSHDEVVGRRDAEPTQLDGDRRDEVAGRLERIDRLEGIAPVAIVFGCARGELLRELLGDRHEASAGVGMGCELERHAADLSGSRPPRRPARRS
jgi:hypothetical protein